MTRQLSSFGHRPQVELLRKLMGNKKVTVARAGMSEQAHKCQSGLVPERYDGDESD